MKRIISGLLILTIMLSSIVVFADTSADNEAGIDMTAYNEAYRVLEKLSLINVGDDFAYDAYITRGRFAKLVADCMTSRVGLENTEYSASGFFDVGADYKYCKEICFLKEMGIISGNGTGMFNPDAPISFNEAMHLMLIMLGYNVYINANGGYIAGDYAALRRADIDINTFNDDTCYALLPLICECLEGNIFETNGITDGSVEYKMNGSISGLEFFFDIVKETGVLQADSTESVLLNKDIEKNRVVIDNKSYIYDEVLDLYVGESVDYYYRSSSSSVKELILLRSSDENDILEITAEELDDFSDMSYVYRKDESKSTKSIKINGSETIVYNSKPMTAFDKKLMVPGDGKVVFIDNDNDGKYEVIRIYSYDSFVVDSVNKKADGTYTLLPKSMYGLGSYDTDLDVSKLFNASGKAITFDRISAGNSVSVYAYYENGKKVIYRAYVTDKKVSGDLNAINKKGNEMRLVIGETEYGVAYSYRTQANALKCDYNLVFYLDYYGNVIGIGGDSTTTMAYGYLLDMKSSDKGIKQTLQLKVFSEVGNVVVYDCAKKVTIDGTVYTDITSVYDRLEQSDGVDNIIRYAVNSNKEIICIDLWENMDYIDSESDIFNNLKLVNSKAELYLKKSYKNFGGNIKYDENTVFFYLPIGTETVEDGMRIVTSKDLTSDGWYEVSAYTSNTDKMIPEVCLLKNAVSKNSGYAQCGLVSEISEKRDDNTGDIRLALTMEQYNKTAEYMVRDKSALKDLPEKTLKKGDIIRYFTTYDGYIETVTLIYRADGNVDGLSVGTVEAFSNGARFAIGTAFDKDDKYIKIYFGTPESDVYPTATKLDVYNIESFKKVIIIDTTSPRLSISDGGGINDISVYVADSVGSKVILNTEFGEERVLYIVKR